VRGVPHGLICGLLLVLTSCGSDGQRDDQGRQLPPAPMGVTAVAGSATSVHVMWNLASGDPAATQYVVYRDGTKVKEVPAAEHMVDITRLEPSTTYTFTVRALDADGAPGLPSEQVSATTPAAVAADDQAPTSPGRANGRTVGSGSVQLSWQKSTDDRGVASYDIYQGDSKIHSVGGGLTATVVTGLRAGTSYSFTVKARDAADNVSPPSSAVRLTTAAGSDDGKGTAPTDFRATTHLGDDGAYYLDLSWTPPPVDGVITEYQILLDAKVTTSLVWGTTAPSGKATYSFYVGRDAGVKHRVRIRAMLPDGTWGGYSVEATVTTGAKK